MGNLQVAVPLEKIQLPINTEYFPRKKRSFMIQIGLDYGTSPGTCHSHLCATGTSVGWPQFAIPFVHCPCAQRLLVLYIYPLQGRGGSGHWTDWIERYRETEVGIKLNTQGGWTLQESRVDFAILCTVVPWDLHSQNKHSKAKLLGSSRIDAPMFKGRSRRCLSVPLGLYSRKMSVAIAWYMRWKRILWMKKVDEDIKRRAGVWGGWRQPTEWYPLDIWELLMMDS